MTSSRFAKPFALLAMCTLMLVGCSSKNNNGPKQPQCSDGKDNDGDGLVDFPEDPGCTSATDDTEDSQPAPQCSDGRDNDGDGKIDYPEDPGCSAPNQDDETDDCPNGPGCPQCSNGKDDDNNGLTDYPADPGCTSAADPTEKTADPNACGPGLVIKELPTSGTDMGTFDASMSSSTNVSPCGEDSGGPAFAYQITVDHASALVATTNLPDTTADTVLDVRSAQCGMASSEVKCNDDVDSANQIFFSTVQVDVMPGTYYIIVKGRSQTETGNYSLQVNLYKHSGDACTDVMECAPGLTCRVPHGQTDMICFPPVCSDGIDDDNDGKMDYPDDPGCLTPADDTEDDDCPNGPNCPACANGKDDDNDGHTDYPADPSCTAASGASEACSGEQDPILPIAAPTTSSTLTGMHDDQLYPDSCSEFGSATAGGADRLYTITVPPLKSLTVDNVNTTTPDIVLEVLPSTCTQPNIACNESFSGSTVTTGPLSAGTYIIVADASDPSQTGAFDLHVKGILQPNQSCDAADTLGGVFVCDTVNPCTNIGGSMKCKPTQCSDGMDNDSDGKKDYPDDPGCTSPDDDSETDDCATHGPTCPACSDGIDNDGDGKIDYPLDLQCTSAAGASEACLGDTDPVVTLTMGATSGDNTTAHDDHQYEAMCGEFGAVSGGNDQVYKLVIPAVTALTVGTTGGVDTVVSLLAASCGLPSLACNDESGVTFGDSLFTTGALAAGTYYIDVDGYTTGSVGPYMLNVSGTLAVGASCETNKTLNGALTCPAAHACGGTAGSKTCQ